MVGDWRKAVPPERKYARTQKEPAPAPDGVEYGARPDAPGNGTGHRRGSRRTINFRWSGCTAGALPTRRWGTARKCCCRRCIRKNRVPSSLLRGLWITSPGSHGARTPVICSETSSLPEVVGDAARLVDPLNPRSIAEAIVQVANSHAGAPGCGIRDCSGPHDSAGCGCRTHLDSPL